MEQPKAPSPIESAFARFVRSIAGVPKSEIEAEQAKAYAEPPQVFFVMEPPHNANPIESAPLMPYLGNMEI